MVYVDEWVYVCGEFKVGTWCMWMSVCMYVESLDHTVNKLYIVICDSLLNN